MKTSKFAPRLFALSLAFASIACRQSGALAAGDAPPDDAPVAAPATSPEPKRAAAPGTRIVRPLETVQGVVRNPATAATSPPAGRVQAAQNSGGFGESGGFVAAGGTDQPLARPLWFGATNKRWQAGTELPVILTTESIDAETQGQWLEDLRVMDKLLLNVRGTNDGLSALGVQVAPARQMPMYVEDAGVVLTAGVNWPLAAAPVEEGKAGKPRSVDSPWERAKQELAGGRAAGVRVDGPEGAAGFRYIAEAEQAPPPVFDQKKLDHLLDDILTILPQASNFRHLKATESVIVTVVGTDDAGRPVRLTMKAKKSDIDDAAAKKIDAATFKQRVTQRIG